MEPAYDEPRDAEGADRRRRDQHHRCGDLSGKAVCHTGQRLVEDIEPAETQRVSDQPDGRDDHDLPAREFESQHRGHRGIARVQDAAVVGREQVAGDRNTRRVGQVGPLQ